MIDESKSVENAVGYGCIGARLGHSWSVDIHALLGSYPYRLMEMNEEEVGVFLHNRAFNGINVTIPYKQTVIPYLDAMDESAREIGAVNTIVNRNGGLCGYNTDFYGMNALLSANGIRLANKCVAILGTGGTSLTARAVALHGGASRVVRVSRAPCDSDCISYADLYAMARDVNILINTTPVGMFPHPDAMPVDPADFPALSAVVDAVYRPLRTRLVLRAQSCGLTAVGGLYMLVAQAAKAAELFTGNAEMTGKIRTVYQKILSEKQNTVLIGMPGSGKTTLGRLLAQKLNAPFADTDKQVAERVKMPIPAYMEAYGEDAFRKEETAAIRALSSENGFVIATGGGAVTRADNITLLKQNGQLIFTDRPLSDIPVTKDRPLSRNKDTLIRLYEERAPLYRAAQDLTVPVSGTPQETLCRLLQILNETQKRNPLL